MPADVASDSSWRAAFLILNSEPFVNRAWVWNHVDLVRCSIFFPQILEHPWSSSEQHLLEIAASLFNSDLSINLYRAFNTLDDRQSLLALRAIAEFARVPVTSAGRFGFDREVR